MANKNYFFSKIGAMLFNAELPKHVKKEYNLPPDSGP